LWLGVFDCLISTLSDIIGCASQQSSTSKAEFPMRLTRRILPAALLAIGLSGPAMAQVTDPSFRLNNRSGQTINEVYVSSSEVSSWGQDRLGADVLPAGRTKTIRLPNGQCVNDIKVVFANGRTRERMRVNTCNITDYNIDP
jgi:hypothetical protein